MIHVFDAMGTTISISADAAADVEGAERVFRAADARFSLQRHDSELARVNRGELALPRSSATLRELYALGAEWSARTDGWFTTHRPDGALDLNGVAKAWAMERAADALGSGPWCLNAGGDVLVSGAGYSVGVVDPHDRTRMLVAIDLGGSRRAVATSGSAERGDHIWRHSNAQPEFLQVTVVANDIMTADVLATTIVAGGALVLQDVTARFDVDVITVDRDGAMLATRGIRQALAA